MAGPVPFERRVFPAGAAAMGLVSGVSSPTDLTFTVDAVADSVPTTGPGYVIFDLGLPTEEAVRWTSRSGTTFTIPDTQSRGCGGTEPTGHNPGSSNVTFGFVPADFDEANYWANQLNQIQNPGDTIQGAGPDLVQVTPIGAEGQRWAVDGGLGAWVDPEIPAPSADGDILTQVAGEPVWGAPFNPVLDTNASPPWTSGSALGPNATTSPAPVNTTYATLTFVAPPSGNIELTYNGFQLNGSDGWYHTVSWRNRSSGATVGGVYRTSDDDAAGIHYVRVTVLIPVTGLTPGGAYTLDLYHQMNGGTAGVAVYDCYVKAVAV